MRIKSWEDFYQSTPTFPDMLRWVATHSGMVTELAASKTVLEIGTGTGMLSAFLSHFCDLVVTVDSNSQVLAASRPFLDVARGSVWATEGDAFALPFRDRSFDAIFSQGLFEHFTTPEIQALTREQVRVASRVYISVPSVFYPHVGRRGPGLVGNERLLNARAWKRILSDFEVHAEYYSDFKVLTVAGKVLPWPAQLLLRVDSPGL